MNAFLDQMARLSAAEEFFQALDVPFEPTVLQVKRLHILKAFNQCLAALDLSGLDEVGLRNAYTAALTTAYSDIAEVDPRQAKLFKVFQTAPTRTFVPLSEVGR
jgi:nitrogenase-stabilizing/protective protein